MKWSRREYYKVGVSSDLGAQDGRCGDAAMRGSCTSLFSTGPKKKRMCEANNN